MPRIKDTDNRGALQGADTFPVDRPSGNTATHATLNDIIAAVAASVSISYTSLVALMSASGLIPGQAYKISDHKTECEAYTGSLEPLILTAATVNTFRPIVTSELFPNDIIHYSIVDPDSYFSKGRITYREDTILNIVACLDWRNRWSMTFEDALGSANFTEFEDTTGTFASLMRPLFDPDQLTSGGIRNVKIGQIEDSRVAVIGGGIRRLIVQDQPNGIIVKQDIYATTIGSKSMLHCKGSLNGVTISAGSTVSMLLDTLYDALFVGSGAAITFVRGAENVVVMNGFRPEAAIEDNLVGETLGFPVVSDEYVDINDPYDMPSGQKSNIILVNNGGYAVDMSLDPYEGQIVTVIDKDGTSYPVHGRGYDFLGKDVGAAFITSGVQGSVFKAVFLSNLWVAIGDAGPEIRGASPVPFDMQYAEIMDKITLNTLLPFQTYRICNFATSRMVGGTQDAPLSYTEAEEPIIVTAATNDSLFAEARSESHPKDIIRYTIQPPIECDVTNLGMTFAHTGHITYRKDTTLNIEMSFDWRGVKHRRWSTAGAPSVFDQVFQVDVDDLYVDVYAVANARTEAKETYNVIICDGTGHATAIEDPESRTQIPNIVIAHDSCRIEIGSRGRDINIGAGVTKILIGSSCNNITIGDSSSAITLGVSCGGMSFGVGCANMQFENCCGNVVIGDGCFNVSGGASATAFVFGTSVQNIRVGAGSSTITLGAGTAGIDIGVGCGNVNLGVSCQAVSIGAASTNLFLADTVQGVSIGNMCNDIHIDDASVGISIGNTAHSLNLTSANNLAAYANGATTA